MTCFDRQWTDEALVLLHDRAAITGRNLVLAQQLMTENVIQVILAGLMSDIVTKDAKAQSGFETDGYVPMRERQTQSRSKCFDHSPAFKRKVF